MLAKRHSYPTSAETPAQLLRLLTFGNNGLRPRIAGRVHPVWPLPSWRSDAPRRKDCYPFPSPPMCPVRYPRMVVTQTSATRRKMPSLPLRHSKKSVRYAVNNKICGPRRFAALEAISSSKPARVGISRARSPVDGIWEI